MRSLRCAFPPLLAATLCLLLSTSAWAQQRKEVELTKEQLRLNNQAVDALNKKPADTETAVTLMKAALALGNTGDKDRRGDLLYMTLGRAYQLQDKCEQADKYFLLAEKAPSVKGLPQNLVESRMLKYRGEMRQTCSGKLMVTCNDPRIQLQVGDKAPKCGTPLKVPPGSYIVNATLKDGEREAKQSVTVKVQGAQTATAAISLVVERAKTAIGPGVDNNVRLRKNTTPALIAGISTLVLTAAWAGVTFIPNDLDALQDDLQLCNDDPTACPYEPAERDRLFDEFQTRDRSQFRLQLILGGAAAAGAVATVLLYTFASEERDTSASGPAPYLHAGPGSASVGMVWNW